MWMRVWMCNQWHSLREKCIYLCVCFLFVHICNAKPMYVAGECSSGLFFCFYRIARFSCAFRSFPPSALICTSFWRFIPFFYACSSSSSSLFSSGSGQKRRKRFTKWNSFLIYKRSELLFRSEHDEALLQPQHQQTERKREREKKQQQKKSTK